MSWQNSDGLYVKFGLEEGKVAQGGEVNKFSDIHEYVVTVDYSEMLSATYAIIDGGSAVGPQGVVIPEGLRITEVEVFAQSAFTLVWYDWFRYLQHWSEEAFGSFDGAGS